MTNRADVGCFDSSSIRRSRASPNGFVSRIECFIDVLGNHNLAVRFHRSIGVIPASPEHSMTYGGDCTRTTTHNSARSASTAAACCDFTLRETMCSVFGG